MNARRRAISLALWVVAAAATFWLWHVQTPEHADMPGLIASVPLAVGPLEAGRVDAVHVAAGQTVAAGDPLARLDPTTIDAELTVARAQHAEALAAVEAAARALDIEARRETLEATARVMEARMQASDARARKAALEGELAALRAEIRRLSPLVDEGVIGAEQIAKLRARRLRLRRETEHLPATVEDSADRSAQLDTLLDDLNTANAEVRVGPLEARAETEARRIEALLRRRAALTLRAPRAGRVLRVIVGPGAAVTAGAAVVELAPTDATRVMAWLPERSVRHLAPGDRVAVQSTDRAAGEAVVGTVESLGGAIVQMPPRLWLDPHSPGYGRPVHIRIDNPGPLLPDERVQVARLLEPERSLIDAQAAPEPTFETLVVPAALQRASRIEISGALWLPERARYLVVSDDTGHRDAHDDAPWLFTIDRAGKVDPEPLVIEGIKRVSDLEAITRAPDGAIYLVCSQSRSRKGKRPKRRQRLIRARLTDAGLVAEAHITLHRAISEALGPDARARLGLSDAIDIEGMAWHEDGLLLGLKSPFDDGGRARIWHIGQVDRLFADDGFIPGGATISPYATLALPTGPNGAPGGISELWVDDSILYILSTVPDGPPAGAAWRVIHPHAEPERLATWARLKPEGLTRGPDGMRVFFDRGDAPPGWAWLEAK